MQSLRLELPGAPPLLNQTLRMSFKQRMAMRNKWYWIVVEALGRRPWPRIECCTAIYTRGWWSRPGDWDNVAASSKVLFDAIVKNGILPDDSPTYILSLEIRQEKFRKKDLKTMLELIPQEHASRSGT